MSLRHLLPYWLLLCSGVAAASTGDPASAPPASYTTRLWQTEDGLPQNSVTAIVQARDGYLWVATYGGLARFDGVRFRTFDSANSPELGDSRIVSLFEDRDGVLWIGHDSGVITRYHAGRFEPVRSNSEHAAERAVAISQDVMGILWVLRESGTLETVDGTAAVGLPESHGRPQVLGMVRGADGMLYVNDDGTLSRLSDGKVTPVEFPPAQHSWFVVGIGSARTQGVWVARDWMLEKRTGDRLLERRGTATGKEGISLTSLVEMRNGGVAVGTVEHGLFLNAPDGSVVHLNHANGLPQDWVRAMYEDREGNLWVGAGSGGLVEIVATAFTTLSPPGGWGGRSALALATDHTGALWIGTEGAGMYRYQDDRWTHFDQEQGLEHPFVWAIAESGDGSVLAGTWGGGIFRLAGDRFQRIPEYPADAGPVLGLEAASNELWIATTAGLLRWPAGGALIRMDDGVGAAGRVYTVVHDAKGTVWFGGAGGLGRIQHGQLTRFRTKDGLPTDTILSVLPQSDGEVWIGTAFGGLVRWKDGRFATIGIKQGLPNNIVCHVIDDGLGYLWLSTHHGLVRAAKQDLMRCADGATASVRFQVFDRNDGLPTIEFSAGLKAAGCVTPDGRLWFPSSKGVVAVDPRRIRPNPFPPPVVLESVQIDGRVQDIVPATMTQLTLKPDHHRLEFQFTGLSLTAPAKVAFKYRLDGIDQTWVDAGTKRTASYSRLPAGRYVFQVIAANNDGVWNETGASITCVVLPFLWQTWWFLSLSAIVVLGIVVWAVRHFTRRRLERRLEELERRHAVERERARIARDIHDDIGATLTRITMLSQCLPPAAAPAQAASVGNQIYETAREATRALDEIVWAVNPRHDSLEGLASYMGKFAQDYLGAAAIRCRFDLPVQLPGWPVTADVRHHLFLALKEVLNNAVKHAQAKEVCISLRVAEDSFVLAVADDGVGFDPAAAPLRSADRAASGNGLANLKRRLASIGGACEIASEPGRGTRIAFIVGIVRADQSRGVDGRPESVTSTPSVHP